MSGLILISDNVKARLKPYRLGRKKDPSFPPISLSCQDSDCHRSLLSLQTHLGLGALLRLLHGRLDPLPCLLPRSCPCTAEPRYPPCTCMMATMLAGYQDALSRDKERDLGGTDVLSFMVTWETSFQCGRVCERQGWLGQPLKNKVEPALVELPVVSGCPPVPFLGCLQSKKGLLIWGAVGGGVGWGIPAFARDLQKLGTLRMASSNEKDP